MNADAKRRILGMSVVLIALCWPTVAIGQGYLQGFGQQAWSVPSPVVGGYVDVTNGNLHLEIPIASIAERGRIPFVAKLVYDSHIWTEVSGSGSTSWQPTNVPSVPTTWGGWRLVTSAGTGATATIRVGSGTCYVKNGNLEIGYP